MIKNKNRRFTLKLSISKDESTLIDMDLKTVLLFCKEMNVLKQMWFGVNVTEKEIINSDKKILTLHYDYNITQRNFIDLIKILKYEEILFTPMTRFETIKKIEAILDTIIKLGGCEKVENKLLKLKKQQQQREMKQININKEYSEKAKTPLEDVKDLYEWRTVKQFNLNLITQEAINKHETYGFKLTYFDNKLYYLRRIKDIF
jgi:hypothetical protein